MKITECMFLQTRLKDWQEGGLNSEYFFQRMSEVNATLQQYENSAVPPGWACHWDRYAISHLSLFFCNCCCCCCCCRHHCCHLLCHHHTITRFRAYMYGPDSPRFSNSAGIVDVPLCLNTVDYIVHLA